MQFSSTQCDPDLLRQSLSDALSERQEEALALHLEQCTTCRDLMESLAGTRDDWTRIEAALRTEQSSDDLRSSDSGDSADGNRFIADFAVDFLEPAGDTDALGRLDNIEIREVIGYGGNGIVLKGFQAELNRLVAAKVMAPHLAASAAARRRFAREAQATAAIVHPAVMPILSVNSKGRLPYIVMPYVDCESLQDRIDREGPLPALDVLRIGVQVARGLAAAHAQGLVHRDVKPANILLEKGVDRVMLTDFGLARAIDDASLTRSGLIAGTPQYMSPEQARGDSVDTRSDLFSLGSVLYAMCTGRAPFRAETSYGILRRVTDDEPRSIRDVNPEIPVWLEGIAKKLLKKLPEERFAGASVVAELLEECVAHVQQPTVSRLPAAVREISDKSAQRFYPRRIVLVGVVVVCVLAAVLFRAQITETDPGDSDHAGGSPTGNPALDEVGPIHLNEANEDAGTVNDASNDWVSRSEMELNDLNEEINQFMQELESELRLQGGALPSEI
ncbi:MAG: serine/threonine-protein kinase [Planctomycetaceae bacterium]